MAEFETMKAIGQKRKNPFYRNRKKFLLALGCLLGLAIVICAVLIINAVIAANQITMYVEVNGIKMENGETYPIRAGDVISVEASSKKAKIARIGYSFGYGENFAITDVYSNHVTITIPENIVGYTQCLRIQAVTADESEKADQKANWRTFYLLYTEHSGQEKTEPVYDKQSGDLIGMYTDAEQQGRFLEGKGIITLTDGTVCEGTWKDEKPTGSFVCTFPGGSKYVGSISDSYRPEGTGTFYYTNGIEIILSNVAWAEKEEIVGADGQGGLYSGIMAGDSSKGYCSIVWDDGSCYRGECLNNALHGQGTYQTAEGDYYIGAWENGARNGHGTMSNSNGDIYEGNWQNGIAHGQGKMTYANGNVYEGQWENDQYHGYGKLTMPDGYAYEGNFVNGAAEGHGTATYANGDVYVGNFKNGVPHGQGTMTRADGSVLSGEWNDGTFVG